jgi:anti-sigma regulatory factor (Ser/Thr protein kinase)
VARLLGPSHPCRAVAVLLASELATNSVRHSGSAVPGETVTVTVVAWDAGVRVEVTDRKTDSVPVLRPADDDAEGSRGLRLVEELADRWGYERNGDHATTWFEIQALSQSMQHSAVSDGPHGLVNMHFAWSHLLVGLGLDETATPDMRLNEPAFNEQAPSLGYGFRAVPDVVC